MIMMIILNIHDTVLEQVDERIAMHVLELLSMIYTRLLDSFCGW
jgi:hypothetical protein